jgi:hypothetical protein
MKFGIAMAGLEERFQSFLIDEFKESDCYLEIGVAYGGTFSGVHHLVCRFPEYTMIGVDPNKRYLDPKLDTESWAWRQPEEPPDVGVNFYPYRFEAVADSISPRSVKIALIDACHGKACVINHFSLVEPKIVDGGFVLFHDFGTEDSGPYQDHCDSLCNVVGACKELGLIGNHRPHWKFQEAWLGKEADMGIFQKTV